MRHKEVIMSYDHIHQKYTERNWDINDLYQTCSFDIFFKSRFNYCQFMSIVFVTLIIMYHI